MRKWLDSLGWPVQILAGVVMLALLGAAVSLTLLPAVWAWQAGNRVEVLLWMILTVLIWKPVK